MQSTNLNNIIVLFAIPRTGSNNICSLINNSNNIILNTEDFNRNLGIRCMNYNIKKYIINRINEENNNSINNKNLSNYLQKYPEKYLKFLSEYNPNKFLLFKLFYTHLPLGKMITIFFKVNKHSKKIILKRDFLEIYVSKKIAEKVNKQYNFDTTNIRLKINFRDFIKFHIKWKKYYEILEKYKDENTIILNYNDLLSLSELKKYNYIKNKLNSINVKLDEKEYVTIKFFKQTKASLNKQIINYDEFIKLYNNYKIAHF